MDTNMEQDDGLRSQSLLSRLGPMEEITPEQDGTTEPKVTGKDRINMLLDTPLGEDPETYHAEDEMLEDEGVEGTYSNTHRAGEGGLRDRIGNSKIYLLEESGTIVHYPNIEDREEVDPDFSYLENLDGESPVRDCALHLSGYPLQNLSTSQVFSYVTIFAPKPVGIEWISDTRLCIVYGSPSATKTALELLAKTGFDPYPPQSDDPLELRSSQPLPDSMRESIIAGLGEDGKKRNTTRARMEDGLVITRKLEDDDENLPEGLRPGARLDIRYAMESDIKAKTKASESEWYKKHGRWAGKERGGIVPEASLLTDKRKYGRYADDEPEEDRPRRERNRSASPRRRNEPRRGTGKRTAQDLDKELDMFLAGDAVEEPVRRIEDRERPRRAEGGQRREGGGRRPQAKQEDLDAELEAYLQSR